MRAESAKDNLMWTVDRVTWGKRAMGVNDSEWGAVHLQPGAGPGDLGRAQGHTESEFSQKVPKTTLL